MAAVLIGSAVYLGLQAQTEARISVSNVATSLGPCENYGNSGYGAQVVNYSILLTNSGSRDAYAILYLYANGEFVGWTNPILVPAGHTVTDFESMIGGACGPVTGTAAVHSVSPVP